MKFDKQLRAFRQRCLNTGIRLHQIFYSVLNESMDPNFNYKQK